MDFREQGVAALVADVKAGRVSAEEVARSTLARIDHLDTRLNAFVARVPEDEALAEARQVDARIARGEDPGRLAGVPLAVKDLEDVRGLRTTFGSSLWAEAPPARADSVQVARLRAAGAVVVGKTNTPEFGCKGATDNALFGPTLNPWNLEFSPGGSSGGSAAALAAGLVPLATGSDGGGSIRIPAALCGFSGFKASQGRVPNGGPVPPTTGLLSVRGPMARTVRDTVLALDAVRGETPTDIFSLPDGGGAWLDEYDRRRPPRRLIWAPTLGFARLDTDVLRVCEAAVQRLRDAGVEIRVCDRVLEDHPLRHWWALWTTAMARKLGDRRDTPEWARIDPPLQKMVEHGAKVSAVDYARAIDACHVHAYELTACLEAEDGEAILCPTVAGRAPRSGSDGMIDGLPTAAWVEMTFGLNMTRNPAASVHAGFNSDGMPVGLQVIGPQRADLATLQVAGFVEEVLGGPGSPDFG